MHGLKPGFRIVSVNGTPVSNGDDINRLVDGQGDKVKLGIVVDDEEVEKAKRQREAKRRAEEEEAAARRKRQEALEAAARRRAEEEAEAAAAAKEAAEQKRRDDERRDALKREQDEKQRRVEEAAAEARARADAAAKRRAEVARREREVEIALQRDAKERAEREAEDRRRLADVNRRLEEERSRLGGNDIDRFMNPDLATNSPATKSHRDPLKSFRSFDSATASPVRDVLRNEDVGSSSHVPRLTLTPSKEHIAGVEEALKAPTHIELMREREDAEREAARRREIEDEEAALARRYELAERRREEEARKRARAEEHALRLAKTREQLDEEWEMRRHANMEAEEQRELDAILRHEAMERNLSHRRRIRGEAEWRHAALAAAAAARASASVAMLEFDRAIRAEHDAAKVRRVVEKRVAAKLREAEEARVREARKLQREQAEAADARDKALGLIRLSPKMESQTQLLLDARALEAMERKMHRLKILIRDEKEQLRKATEAEDFDRCKTIKRYIDDVESEFAHLKESHRSLWADSSFRRLEMRLRGYEDVRARVETLKELNRQRSAHFVNALCHQQISLCDAARRGALEKSRAVEMRIQELKEARRAHHESCDVIRRDVRREYLEASNVVRPGLLDHLVARNEPEPTKRLDDASDRALTSAEIGSLLRPSRPLDRSDSPRSGQRRESLFFLQDKLCRSIRPADSRFGNYY